MSMTESEAIEELKHSIVSYEAQNKNNVTCDLTREVLNMAINALAKIDSIKKIIDCTIICNDANKVKYNEIRKIVEER